MRIGWVSAPAYARTGYGRITNEILSRLVEKYEVVNIGGGSEAIWGGKLNIATESGKQFTVLPTFGKLGGADVVPHYVRRYNLDVVITLWDSFVVGYSEVVDVPVIHYFPIDAPFTRQMYGYVAPAYRLVTYSKFGYTELLKWFPSSKISYIPHGIDTKVFKPYDEETRRKVRASLYPQPVPEDAFLMIFIGANVGERKQIPYLVLIFKEFLKKHPNSYLYLYTNIGGQYPQAHDLVPFANEHGILDHIRYPDFTPVLDPVEDEELAKLYSAADVFTTTTLGEGFGMGILESMACGTPVIGPSCSTIPELVQGHGWVVPTLIDYVFVPVWIPTQQIYPVAGMSGILHAIEEAYNSPEMRKKFGKESREFALNYDWTKIMPVWFKFLETVEEELELLKRLK